MATEEGRHFLKQILDPYEDTAQSLTGYPDSDCSKTIILQVNRQWTVVKSPLLPPGPWDLHAVTTDELVYRSGSNSLVNIPQLDCYQYDDFLSQFIKNVASDQVSMGPIMWCQTTAGNETFTTAAAGFDALNINEYLTGPCRVVGFALEARDTTAEIYKQGALTVYRMPQCNTTEVISTQRAILGDPYVPSSNQLCSQSRLFPTTLAGAMALRDTVTWKSADGAYCVALPYSSSNPLKVSSHKMRAFTAEGPINTVAGTLVPALLNAIQSTNTVAAIVYNNPPQNIEMPFNTSGLYFTGLADQSSITFTARIILEIAPVNNAQLEALARPSPPLDIRAMELLSIAVSAAPVGVRFGDNASGRWTKMVGAILTGGAKILGLLTPVHPGFGIAATAVGSAGLVFNEIDKLAAAKAKKMKKNGVKAPVPKKKIKNGAFTGSSTNRISH